MRTLPLTIQDGMGQEGQQRDRIAVKAGWGPGWKAGSRETSLDPLPGSRSRGR